MAAIFYVSSLSHPPLPAGIGDKSAHTAAYMLLAGLVVRALMGGLPARVNWVTALSALAITIAYGASDEFHQSFVPGRTADVLDWVADARGAVLGTAVCWLWGIIAALPRAERGSRHGL
jgi:VanZ family protein